MKKVALALVMILAGSIASGSVLARGGHGGGHGGGHFGGFGAGLGLGLFVGAPLLWGGYYGSPYYYPPSYYYPPYPAASPPVYMEQGAPAPATAPAPSQAYWWYYCADSQSYYPYVRQCPGGWQRVAPQPPG